MEMQEQIKDKPNSVEISINAKCQYSGKVKVYAETIEEAYNLSVEYSKKIEDLIRSKNS